jgi:hypothetical protein
MQIFDEGGSSVENELNGISSKKKNASRFPDWTEPKDLNPADWRSLKIIKKYHDEGDYDSAMHHAMYNSDTEIREAIPPNVWLEIGGQLTTGREKLKKLLADYPEKYA